MPRRQQSGYIATDDQPLIVLKRDLGGGMNSRQHPQMIADNQAVLLQNIMLETAGQTSIRPGQTQVDATYPPVYVIDDSGHIVLDDSGIPVLGG